MKKSLMRAVLIVILAFALMSTAFADGIPANATETVEIAKGDTMYSLCQKNGFSYSTYKELLMKLNNMKDEYSLTKIRAGKKIILPTSKEAADELCQLLKVETGKKNNKEKQSKPFSEVGDAGKIPAGDSVKFYIVSYTMQKGETVSELLKSWDMSLKTWSQTILDLNGLSDFNHIAAGRSLYFPVEKPEFTNDTTYTVMEHTVQSGDTSYSICRAYGMDYNKALVTLQLLNKNVDFTKIRTNQKLYIPVKGVVIPGTQEAVSAEESYSGYGVVVSFGDMIRIRRENIRQDLGLKIGEGVMPAGYVPQPGDYIYFVCNLKENTLTYIKYVYNVFGN